MLIHKVVEWLALAEKGRKWDEESATPMFEYRSLRRAQSLIAFKSTICSIYFNEDILREGSQDFQVWYDDPQSLAIKYQVRL